MKIKIEWNIEMVKKPRLRCRQRVHRDEQPDDDAHRLLRIVRAVRVRQECRASELGASKECIDATRRHFLEDPVHRDHQDETREHSDER